MTQPNEMRRAVLAVAETFGWDGMTKREVGLLLFSLFRYYAWFRAEGNS
jgi:hypothetical protein